LRVNATNFARMTSKGQISEASIVARLAVQWQLGAMAPMAKYQMREQVGFTAKLGQTGTLLELFFTFSGLRAL